MPKITSIIWKLAVLCSVLVLEIDLLLQAIWSTFKPLFWYSSKKIKTWVISRLSRVWIACYECWKEVVPITGCGKHLMSDDWISWSRWKMISLRWNLWCRRFLPVFECRHHNGFSRICCLGDGWSLSVGWMVIPRCLLSLDFFVCFFVSPS